MIKIARSATLNDNRDKRHPCDDLINDAIREVAKAWPPKDKLSKYPATANSMAKNILPDVIAVLEKRPPPDTKKWPPFTSQDALRARLIELEYPADRQQETAKNLRSVRSASKMH